LRPAIIRCSNCDFLFTTDNSIKKYCSKKCYDAHRIIYNRDAQIHRNRERNGTIKKWVKILREEGFIVFRPSELENLLQ